MEAWAIVVAAGSGVRFGRAKQYAELGDRRVLDLAVAGARRCCRGVVVVVPTADVVVPVAGADAVVGGGATRSASVRAGLAAVPGSADVIAVHDAARPLATDAIWAAVLDAVRAGADGAVPGVPVSDTLKRLDGDAVVETLDRSCLVAVQTPQAFRAPILRAAHAGAGEATDDAALVESLGGRVVVVPGDPHNLKLTTPADLAFAQAVLNARSGART
ncbi:MAG: 2-C-methyl-D-erythritol 4-phosphate cytidylyltransferase [Actinomycetota bacterium]|nr:2-C-methyl-D-erythritol 4-phosphate cytidylyltransferase [Actinomycetota bacterium]